MLAATTSTNALAFDPHPLVWLLVVALVASYVYMVKVVGPRAVPAGQPVVTRKQVVAFGAAMLLLWVGADWPMHDLAEEQLYSLHMVQHMIFAYFVPPLALLATPEWLGRLLVGQGRTYAVVKWLAYPITAGLLFTAITMISHIPGVVNGSVENLALHYTMHLLIVVISLNMWMPIVSPLPELRIGYGGKIMYLFLLSVMPMVPAGWLTFAEGVVYDAYDDAAEFWGMTPTEDQQLAGAVMKLGGSVYLWTIAIVIFFRRFMANWEAQQDFGNRYRIPDAEMTPTNDEAPLTFEQVHEVFQAVPPPDEPARPTGGD
jgi:putative membrane protein